MTTYLFVTQTGQTYDEIEDDPEDFWWSCSKSVKAGDRVLLYVTGGLGIVYEWRATSDALAHTEWGSICYVELVRELTPPITAAEIKATFPFDEWKAPYTNFRGMRSIRIPDGVAARLVALR